MQKRLARPKEYDLTVIIPTLNEEKNIENIISEVNKVLSKSHYDGQILVVDDNSTDGTQTILGKLKCEYPNLYVVTRYNDPGLSKSILDGIDVAKSRVCVIIDADFSHPPNLIIPMFELIRSKNYDIVIGSRYMPGGGIERWSIDRKIISAGATLFGRILFPSITDPVSGFFAVKKHVVENTQIHPRGYKILLEILGKGRWNKVIEVPYTFENRKEGTSKLGAKTIWQYLVQVGDIIRFRMDGGNTRNPK